MAFEQTGTGTSTPGTSTTGTSTVAGATATVVADPAGRSADRGSIGHAAAWLAKQVEVGLSDVDLSPSQYRTLIVLAAGSARSSFLADRLDVRPPSVTAVVDGLVSRGLVDRRAAEGDRRCVAHVLTDEGRRVLAAADEALDTRLYRIADLLGSAELSDRAVEDLGLWRRALLEQHRAGRAERDERR